MKKTATPKKRGKKKPTKIGRPSKRTPELETELLAWLAAGKTLRTFCQAKNLSRTTVYSWAEADPILSEQVARAEEVGAAEIEDEILQIADTGDDEDVQHRKLQIWAREKRLAWNNPEKYGTKVNVAGTVKHVVELTDTERLVRIEQLLKKAEVPQLEVKVEIEPSQNGTEGE